MVERRQLGEGRRTLRCREKVSFANAHLEREKAPNLAGGLFMPLLKNLIAN
jgi:hypothetical protein